MQRKVDVALGIMRFSLRVPRVANDEVVKALHGAVIDELERLRKVELWAALVLEAPGHEGHKETLLKYLDPFVTGGIQSIAGQAEGPKEEKDE